MECVGEFLGLDCDKHIFAYFARHCRHRSSDLGQLKGLVWRLAEEVARAPFCRCLRGAARHGRDHAGRQIFYGFRLHARLTWPGLISEVVLAPRQPVRTVSAGAPRPQCP